MTNSINLFPKLNNSKTDPSSFNNPSKKSHGRLVNLFSNPWAQRALWATAAIATAVIAYSLFQKSPAPSRIDTCILYEAMLNDNQAANCYVNAAKEGDYLAQVRISRAYCYGELGTPINEQKCREWFEKILESTNGKFNLESYQLDVRKMCYYNPSKSFCPSLEQ